MSDPVQGDLLQAESGLSQQTQEKAEPSIVYTTAQTGHVPLILALQAQNIMGALSPAQIASEGFLTLSHSTDLFTRMNEAAPTIIALDRSNSSSDGSLTTTETIAGYCMMTPLSFVLEIPLLQKGTARSIAGKTFHGRPITIAPAQGDPKWFFMGQVLVSSAYRRQGIFDGLYAALRDEYSKDYDFVLTEVSSKNPRSLRAHLRVGFTELHVHEDTERGAKWHTIIWDWSAPGSSKLSQ